MNEREMLTLADFATREAIGFPSLSTSSRVSSFVISIILSLSPLSLSLSIYLSFILSLRYRLSFCSLARACIARRFLNRGLIVVGTADARRYFRVTGGGPVVVQFHATPFVCASLPEEILILCAAARRLNITGRARRGRRFTARRGIVSAAIGISGK